MSNLVSTVVLPILACLLSGLVTATAMSLQKAAEQGDVDRLRELLAAGADPSEFDSMGRTALVVAAGAGQPQIVKLLIAAGANPSLPDRVGFTPLYVAVARGDPQCIKELLDAGVQVNEQDPNGWTALMHATKRRDLAILRLLLGAGADPSLKAADGTTAADIARWRTLRARLTGEGWWELTLPTPPWDVFRRALQAPPKAQRSH